MKEDTLQADLESLFTLVRWSSSIYGHLVGQVVNKRVNNYNGAICQAPINKLQIWATFEFLHQQVTNLAPLVLSNELIIKPRDCFVLQNSK